MQAACLGVLRMVGQPDTKANRTRARFTLYRMARVSSKHFGTPAVGSLYGQLEIAAGERSPIVEKTELGNFLAYDWQWKDGRWN